MSLTLRVWLALDVSARGLLRATLARLGADDAAFSSPSAVSDCLRLGLEVAGGARLEAEGIVFLLPSSPDATLGSALFLGVAFAAGVFPLPAVSARGGAFAFWGGFVTAGGLGGGFDWGVFCDGVCGGFFESEVCLPILL